jgi:ribosomal protein L40E
MAFCRNCGAELAPDILFCERCGTKIVPPPIIKKQKNQDKSKEQTISLEPGESVIFTDTWLKQPVSGFILMIVFYGFGLAFLAGLPYTIIILPLFFFFGQLGFSMAFIRPKNQIVVTDKRLMFVGRNMFFKPKNYHVPIQKITNVTFVDFGFYGLHLHYRVNLNYISEKNKNKFLIVIPKNAKNLANAISAALAEGSFT